MPAPASSTDSVQFGVFELDLQRAELRKQGVKVKLQEQPLNVLQVLLEKPGQIVSREELRQRVWSANTFVEFDQGLYSAIARLREALGDSSDSPRFIETVPRRGYRFIAPVTKTAPPNREPEQERERSAGPPGPAALRRWITPLIPGVVGGALLLSLAFGILGSREWLRNRTTPIRSIAVLPLQNLSNDRQQEYFADGMTDELITQLAQIGSLRVISRTSAMHYKNTDKTLPQIAAELNVDGIVEGTVERSVDRVRIRVQLIQAASDRHLWARTYDRELSDTLALQSEAASDIVREIRATLIPPRRQLRSARQLDPDAYEAYLKGLFLVNAPSPDNITRAIEYFNQATSKDPTYAAAYSGLSNALMEQDFAGAPSQAVRERATLAAQKAIELDPGSAEAHNALAGIRELYDWDWMSAEKEYQRAIELNANFAAAHQNYALFLAFQGRFEQAFAEARRAQHLDPLSAFVRNTYCLGFAVGRRYREAIAKCQQAIELDSTYPGAHGNLAVVFTSMGMYDQAVEQYEQLATLKRGARTQTAHLRKAYALGGRAGYLRAVLRLEKNEGVDPVRIAALYALLGEKDEAFTWLQNAYRQRSAWMESLKEHPYFDNLRADPRFRELIARVGLAK